MRKRIFKPFPLCYNDMKDVQRSRCILIEGGLSVKPRILISRSPESRGLYETAVEKAGESPCPSIAQIQRWTLTV